jgi:hypothetical protein
LAEDVAALTNELIEILALAILRLRADVRKIALCTVSSLNPIS